MPVRTERPTPTRRQAARAQGRLAVSEVLTGVGSMTAGLLVLGFTLTAAVRAHAELAIDCLSAAAAIPPSGAGAHLAAALGLTVSTWAPVGLFTLLGAVLIGAAQTRCFFALAPLRPDLSRLDLVSGLGRLFAATRWFRAFRYALVGLGLCAASGGLLIYWASDITRLATLPAGHWSGPLCRGVVIGSLVLACLMGVPALIDWWVERRQLEVDLMMTPREVVAERRLREGDPHQRARRHELNRQLLVMEDRPERSSMTLVITGGGRTAALNYLRGTPDAPRLLALRRGRLGVAIVRSARRRGIPVFEDADLTRRLADCPAGHEISRPLYQPVARLIQLAYEE